MKTPLLQRGRRAFTLVEVALALGIAAFAIVALMGLLPAGLNTSRDALDEQMATDILLEIESDIRQPPWTRSPASATTPNLKLNLPVTVDPSTEQTFSQRALPIGEGQSTEAPYFRSRIVRRSQPNPAQLAWHVVVEWPAQAPNPANRVETVVVRAEPIEL